MRGKRDEIDIACERWAEQRRKILGIVTRLEPFERLGKLRCTLAEAKNDREGMGQGTAQQNFPEVYRGDALAVHRARQFMSGRMKRILEAHYVFREVPVKTKAPALELSVAAYWREIASLKSYLSGFFASFRATDFDSIVETKKTLRFP